MILYICVIVLILNIKWREKEWTQVFTDAYLGFWSSAWNRAEAHTKIRLPFPIRIQVTPAVWKLAEQNAEACQQLCAASLLALWLLGRWELWLQFNPILSSNIHSHSQDAFQTEDQRLLCRFFIDLLFPYLLNWIEELVEGNSCLWVSLKQCSFISSVILLRNADNNLTFLQ